MLDEIYLRLLLELIPSSFKLSGLDVRRLIDQFNDGAQSRRAYGELVRQVYTNDPDSDIGLTYGEHLHPATLCDLSRSMMTAPTVHSALDLIERYHFIHGASYIPVVHNNDKSISISLAFPYKNRISASQRRFCAEAVFSYILNAFRETVSPDIAPIALCFDYANPSYESRYLRQFNCHSVFNAPMSMMNLDKELLHRDLITQNATLHQIHMSKALDAWQKSERMGDFEYRTISQLMRHHPDSFNSQKLASKLNISVRGLQKRLNKYDKSFSNLANQARRELAKIYLFQMKQSIEFTAEQLGFQTASGFRRFFKTEFGITPAEFVEHVGEEFHTSF